MWGWGLFRDPDVPDAHNVKKTDLDTLTHSDRVVTDVLASYQKRMKPVLDMFTQEVHGRESEADGIRAEGTAGMFEYPRCGMPDFKVDVADDPQLAARWNPEEANWPDACRREILVGRDFNELPGLDQAKTDQVYHALCNNWTFALQDVEMTPQFDRRRTDERMFHRREGMRGGVLAYHYLARDRCDDWLDGAWNSNVNWSAIDLPCTTGTHEVGHGLGMNHNSDPTSTLYPSINPHSRRRYGYPNASDIATLEALGYKAYPDWEDRKPTLEDLLKPRDSDPGPGPGPEPPPDDVMEILRQHEIDIALNRALIKILLRRTS